ncbi:calpain 7, partial [Cladochytrium tenue]
NLLQHGRSRGASATARILEYVERAELMKAKRDAQQPDETRNTASRTMSRDAFMERYAAAFGVKRHYKTQNAILIGLAEVIISESRKLDNLTARKECNERLSEIVQQIEHTKRLSVAAGAGSGQETVRGDLSAAEMAILTHMSYVNGRAFLPWIEDDLHDRVWSSATGGAAAPFSDPDGPLRLSPKQERSFAAWCRPAEFMDAPRMIYLVTGSVITQVKFRKGFGEDNVVTDCSFVASLCVSAAYERRFKKKLITSCIYPQDEFGEPLYNPFGKYIVRLFFNGIHRKVKCRLMCTQSLNGNELWCSIIEKAYMKLMGGYDFLGSNSGVDLHVLTGWIPEHVFVQEDGFRADAEWSRMYSGYADGEVLMTVATGEITDEQSDLAGLVPSHAYAGAFSHLDEVNWTPSLRDALNFDRLMALRVDDGANFWQSDIPEDDCAVENENEASSFGALIEENKDFIAVHVFVDTGCKRLSNPGSCRAIHQGFYINSDHILAAFEVPRAAASSCGRRQLTVVVSRLGGAPRCRRQGEGGLSFTFRVYARAPVRVAEAVADDGDSANHNK